VEVRQAKGLMDAFESRIAAGHRYGSFELDVDPAAEAFLRRGLLVTYRPASAASPSSARPDLSPEEWLGFAELAHTDPRRAFDAYSGRLLSTNGAVDWSDTGQLSFYADGYHRRIDERLGAAAPGSEMLTELYVPRPRLEDFLEEAAHEVRGGGVVYGAVRLIERDRQSFLAWAKESFACVALNLHVDHTAAGIETAQQTARLLIDLARRRGGSFLLTYHRWATREQVLDCYPQFPEFLQQKLRYDPQERFQSEWYRHHRAMFA
ncbi:MAG: hypothetical protein ACREQ9_17320, partial [Candidatus Binatia bacterium]